MILLTRTCEFKINLQNSSGHFVGSALINISHSNFFHLKDFTHIIRLLLAAANGLIMTYTNHSTLICEVGN